MSEIGRFGRREGRLPTLDLNSGETAGGGGGETTICSRIRHQSDLCQLYSVFVHGNSASTYVHY